MAHEKTTWYGGVGEALKAGALFVPPPYSLIPAGLGAMLTAAAWYFAEDRHITTEVTDKSETIPNLTTAAKEPTNSRS